MRNDLLPDYLTFVDADDVTHFCQLVVFESFLGFITKEGDYYSVWWYTANKRPRRTHSWVRQDSFGYFRSTLGG